MTKSKRLRNKIKQQIIKEDILRKRQSEQSRRSLLNADEHKCAGASESTDEEYERARERHQRAGQRYLRTAEECDRAREVRDLRKMLKVGQDNKATVKTDNTIEQRVLQVSRFLEAVQNNAHHKPGCDINTIELVREMRHGQNSKFTVQTCKCTCVDNNYIANYFYRLSNGATVVIIFLIVCLLVSLYLLVRFFMWEE